VAEDPHIVLMLSQDGDEPKVSERCIILVKRSSSSRFEGDSSELSHKECQAQHRATTTAQAHQRSHKGRPHVAVPAMITMKYYSRRHSDDHMDVC